jgi:hypothetical protein
LGGEAHSVVVVVVVVVVVGLREREEEKGSVWNILERILLGVRTWWLI